MSPRSVLPQVSQTCMHAAEMRIALDHTLVAAIPCTGAVHLARALHI